jgi:hypothetical protein
VFNADFIQKILLVFGAVAVTDVFWTLYVTGANDGKIWKASFYSTMIVLCGSTATIEYVQDPRMIIPAALGAFAGTMLPLLWRKHRKEVK